MLTQVLGFCRILLTNLKAERLREKLQRVERERDNFEDRCKVRTRSPLVALTNSLSLSLFQALQAKGRELESQLHDLL